MKHNDLVGGTIKSIWADDDTDKMVVIISTKKHGLQCFEATDFSISQEEDYEEEE